MVAGAAMIDWPLESAVRLDTFPAIRLALQQEGESEDAAGFGGHGQTGMLLQQGFVDDDMVETIPMFLVFVRAANVQRFVGKVGRQVDVGGGHFALPSPTPSVGLLCLGRGT